MIHLAGATALVVVVMFLGMLACSEIGRRIGRARLARNPESFKGGAGAADAAVFGLLGLLIAFTFSGAASRFEARRHLISDEANTIGTAYLRLDVLPADAQPELRALFRRYVDARVAAHHDVDDIVAAYARLDASTALQGEIWSKSVAACGRAGVESRACLLLLPALNDMIDITTTRLTATQNHPPAVIYFLLGGLSLIGALLVGHGNASERERSWLQTTAFAATLALTVYVIVDLEFPRLGLIRIDSADQVLIDLRKSME